MPPAAADDVLLRRHRRAASRALRRATRFMLLNSRLRLLPRSLRHAATLRDTRHDTPHAIEIAKSATMPRCRHTPLRTAADIDCRCRRRWRDTLIEYATPS